MNFNLEGDRIVIPVAKAVLVLTREEFIRGLRRGKRYRRLQAAEARRANNRDGRVYETSCQPRFGAPGASYEDIREGAGDE